MPKSRATKLNRLTFIGGCISWCSLLAFNSGCLDSVHTEDTLSDSVFGGSSQTVKVSSPHAITPVAAEASSSASGLNPASVFQYQNNPYWNAGNYSGATEKDFQWILLDLGVQKVVTEIYLTVKQGPNGYTEHRIEGGLDRASLSVLANVKGNTIDGQVLQVKVPIPAMNIRFLKITTVVSPSWVAWGKIEIFDRAVWTPKNIPKFFGYFGLGPADAVADHVNVGWLGGPDNQTDLAGLQEGQRINVKSILILQRLFFDASNNWELLPNYQDNWVAYKAAIGPYINNIAAFYVMDEPYARVNPLSAVKASAMKARLEKVGEVVRADFPSIPLAMTFCDLDYDVMKTMTLVPNNFDWIGFDYYGGWEGSGGFSTLDRMNLIKGQLSSGQKMIIFPRAFVLSSSVIEGPANCAFHSVPDSDPRVAELLGSMNHYYELALSDSVVIGVFPFLYNSCYIEGFAEYNGVSAVPAVQALFSEMGKLILRGR